MPTVKIENFDTNKPLGIRSTSNTNLFRINQEDDKYSSLNTRNNTSANSNNNNNNNNDNLCNKIISRNSSEKLENVGIFRKFKILFCLFI